jgi:hypothetical protein
METLHLQEERSGTVGVVEAAAASDGKSEHIAELLATVERENRKKSWRFGVAVVLIMAAMFGVYLILKWTWPRMPKFPSFGYLYYLAAAGLAAYFAPTRLQKRATRELAECDDVRAVGPLAEALDKQDGATRGIAMKALQRLLPRLKESDADMLSERQLECLREAMTKKDAPALLPSLLVAVGQVGDESFLENVKSLADGKGHAKKDPAIRAAAQSCLVPLKERVEREQAPRTLLRPAEETGAPGQSLLRPAGHAPGADPAELLRPAE